MERPLLSLGLALLSTVPMLAQTAAAPPSGAAALPPGPGKAIAQRMCVACHGLEVVTAKRATPEDWASTVQLMVSRGAEGTDEEVDILTKYLAASFPAVPDKGSPAAPASSPAASTPSTSHLELLPPRFLTELSTVSEL